VGIVRASWCVVVTAGTMLCAAALKAAEPAAAIREASDRYCEAFNAADAEGLAAQWTADARLVEGGGTLRGRDRIVESLLAWRRAHPRATLAIDLTGIDRLGDTVARVRGRLRFTPEPGSEPHTSDFESLRVLEQGEWRLADSLVGPSATALLDELAWLLGTWKSVDESGGAVHEIRYERSLGGRVITGRGRITSQSGDPVESLEVIHADPRDGVVRSSLWDSTGARATGAFSFDGTIFNRSLVGTSGEAAGARPVGWVQVIAPASGGRMILQSIERMHDGLPMPDGQPIVFSKTE
jgi:uncharacterized protein (TIGR02246 family)